MKFKTIFPIILFSILISLPASAKKWRVNNTLTVPTQVDFLELKDAVLATTVLSGDTIYVEGSAQPYEGGIEIYKQLTIIGPGYLLDQAHLQPTVCSFLPATIGGAPGLFLRQGSDGSFITGLSIISNFGNPISIELENISNITITRNHLETIKFSNGTSTTTNTTSNIFITRNLICDDIFFGCPISINTIMINQNVINGSIDHSCGNLSTTNIANGIVHYNTFRSGTFDVLWIRGSDIAYNLVGEIEAEPGENSTIHDNRLGTDNSTNQGLVAIDDSNIISDYNDTGWDCDSDERILLPPDNKHGVHNGSDPIYSNNPISPANLPAFPVIFECAVQSCGDTTIQVNFSVRSNN